MSLREGEPLKVTLEMEGEISNAVLSQLTAGVQKVIDGLKAEEMLSRPKEVKFDVRNWTTMSEVDLPEQLDACQLPRDIVGKHLLVSCRKWDNNEPPITTRVTVISCYGDRSRDTIVLTVKAKPETGTVSLNRLVRYSGSEDQPNAWMATHFNKKIPREESTLGRVMEVKFLD